MRRQLSELVADNIRAERSRARLRQVDVAEVLGVSKASYVDLEAGRRRVTINELLPLCETFGVTLVDLFRGLTVEELRTLGL